MTNTQNAETLSPTDERVDAAVGGYCQALLFANVLDSEGESVSGAHLDYAPVALSDFTADAQTEIVADVLDFVSANLSDCESYVMRRQDHVGGRLSAWRELGSDFLLSSSGHGAGFFDRGNAAVWGRLQDAARVYGGRYAIVDEDTAPGDIEVMSS